MTNVPTRERVKSSREREIVIKRESDRAQPKGPSDLSSNHRLSGLLEVMIDDDDNGLPASQPELKLKRFKVHQRIDPCLNSFIQLGDSLSLTGRSLTSSRDQNDHLLPILSV